MKRNLGMVTHPSVSSKHWRGQRWRILGSRAACGLHTETLSHEAKHSQAWCSTLVFSLSTWKADLCRFEAGLEEHLLA